MRFRVVLIPFVAASIANCASVTGVDPQSVEDVTNKFLAARGPRVQSDPHQEERGGVPGVSGVVEKAGEVMSDIVHTPENQVVINTYVGHSTPVARSVHPPPAPEAPAVHPPTAPAAPPTHGTAETPNGGATPPITKEVNPGQVKNADDHTGQIPKKTSTVRKTFYWLAGIVGVTAAATIFFKLWQNHHTAPPESTAAAGTVAPAAASSLV